MFRMTIVSRLLALGASVAMSLAVVTLIADYGLPSDGEARMLVQAVPATAANVR